MEAITKIKAMIPDYAKDIRLNIDSVILRSSMPVDETVAIAIAAAFASRSHQLVTALREAAPEQISNGALSAAALMGMNNVWYPFIEMAGDEELKNLRPELRMNAYATSGGIDKRLFEACALAASIVGKCHFCVRSHHELLLKEGLTVQQIRDIGRIAAVINAASMVLTIG